MSHIPRASCDPVPNLARALCAFAPQVPRALVPDICQVVSGLAPHLFFVLRFLVHRVPRTLRAVRSYLPLLPRALSASFVNLTQFVLLCSHVSIDFFFPTRVIFWDNTILKINIVLSNPLK